MTKYINIIRSEFDNPKFPVFTLTDVKVLLGTKTKISSNYLKVLINHMIKREEIKRITRGVYTFHKDIAIVGFAYRPFYYGMEDALSFRNMWNQSTNPLIMTSNVVREGVRKFDGSNYMVKRIKPKLFFGFDFIRYYEFWIPVSDLEKTFLDLIYYKHGIRNEVFDTIKGSINKAKLDEYLEKYSDRFRKKVYKILSNRRL